jgi:hypothetical protein
MLTLDRTDSLLSAIPFERITSWTVGNLGVNGEDFSAIVARLEELEEKGLVDVLSITRERTCGCLQVTAVKFFRTLGVD